MSPELADAIEQSTFTPDDLLTATFSLVASLTEYMTGKRVVVSLRNKYGKCMPVGVDPERVRLL